MIIVNEKPNGDFQVMQSSIPVLREVFVGELMVRASHKEVCDFLKSVPSLGDRIDKKEFVNLRIMQLLAQCASSMMFVVLVASDSTVPRIRMWISQVVITGALLFQLQAFRKSKLSLYRFFISRFTVIGFYVFVACFLGYLGFVINAIVPDTVSTLCCACCAWVAFFLGLIDVFIQINTFSLTVHAPIPVSQPESSIPRHSRLAN